MSPSRTILPGTEPPSSNRESLSYRELEALRKVVGTVRDARLPIRVYRSGLANAAAVVGARFGSVFLRQGGHEQDSLLKLACAFNWPQAAARFLGEFRVRLGNGPTGIAAARGEPVAVEDVFADRALSHWWQPARELGFAAVASFPLLGRHGCLGAATYYFDVPRRLHPRERELLWLFADLMAAVPSGRGVPSRLREGGAADEVSR